MSYNHIYIAHLLIYRILQHGYEKETPSQTSRPVRKQHGSGVSTVACVLSPPSLLSKI